MTATGSNKDDSAKPQKKPTYWHGPNDAGNGASANTRPVCQTVVGRLCSHRNHLGAVCVSWFVAITIAGLERHCLVAHATAASLPAVAQLDANHHYGVLLFRH